MPHQTCIISKLWPGIQRALERGVLLALVAPLVLAGCDSFSRPSGGGSVGKKEVVENGKQPVTQPAEQLPPPKPLLKDWPKPAVALMLSGEMHGYMEPCGCSLTQSGGLARRADLLKKLEDQGWPVVGLDLGGLLKRTRRQDQIKFETILASLGDLNYSAIGMGPEELRLGPEYLLAQHMPDPDNPDKAVAFVSANVVFFDSPDLGTPIPYKTITVEGVKIGVTSVLGPSLKETVAPEGVETQIAIHDPEVVLPGVLENLQAEQPDLLVLLSHGSQEEARKYAEKFTEFDLILTAGGPEEPDPKPIRIGNTMLVLLGHKGKHVGIVGYYPDDEEQPLRFELVDLDSRRFAGAASMQEHMRFYQDRLKVEQIAVSDELNISHPQGHSFEGAAKCGECHTKAFAKWKESKHAHAFDSLKIGRKGQEAGWISRIHDPECLACHVTGWEPQEVLRYEGGYVSEDSTPHLLNQQCENCHGPGSRHVELERLWKKDLKSVSRDDLASARRDMHLTKEIAKNRVCYQCHDLDNSPGFQFDKYWKEVEHPWKD